MFLVGVQIVSTANDLVTNETIQGGPKKRTPTATVSRVSVFWTTL